MAQSVLVVDDEPSILLALEFMMRNAGFEVRTARDGEEALKAPAVRKPDLLLLDVMMPPPDGYDLSTRKLVAAA
jgi:two-component system, OmpR family, alkaline phosphatase synthesis response regulator PhoP